MAEFDREQTAVLFRQYLLPGKLAKRCTGSTRSGALQADYRTTPCPGVVAEDVSGLGGHKMSCLR